MLHGETLHSAMPWDIPWWAADHAIFFGVLYIVLALIGTGVAIVVVKSWIEACKDGCDAHH